MCVHVLAGVGLQLGQLVAEGHVAQAAGVRVVAPLAGSPAEAVGLQAGDILLAAGGYCSDVFGRGLPALLHTKTACATHPAHTHGVAASALLIWADWLTKVCTTTTQTAIAQCSSQTRSQHAQMAYLRGVFPWTT